MSKNRNRLTQKPEPSYRLEWLPKFDGEHRFTIERREGGKEYAPIDVTATVENVLDRANKFVAQAAEREYVRRKQEWERKHPEATQEEYQRAITQIAKGLGL
jgi:hypothetical protein